MSVRAGVMRLGVIADIHGNLPALEQVLDALKEQAVEQIICLGDVCVDGPFPGECIAALRAHNITTISGNNDAWASVTDLDEAALAPTWLGKIAQWSVAQLTADERRWLAALPKSLRVDLAGGQPLYAFHATPHSDRIDVLPETSMHDLRQWFASEDDALIAIGHTHEQFLRRVGNRVFVNPGSVGAPLQRELLPRIVREPRADYAVITASAAGVSITLHAIALDPQKWRDQVVQSGMPHAERWLMYG